MKIYLRPSVESDAKLIVKWRNSEKIREHCLNKNAITENDHLKFFDEFIKTGKYKQFIVERVDEVMGVASYPIGVVSLKDFDDFNNRSELCLFTSDDEEWNTESQNIAIKMILSKAFDEYKMNKVYSYVFREFSEECDLLRESGFEQDACFINEAKNLNGEYVDIFRYSISAERFHKINAYKN